MIRSVSPFSKMPLLHREKSYRPTSNTHIYGVWGEADEDERKGVGVLVKGEGKSEVDGGWV